MYVFHILYPPLTQRKQDVILLWSVCEYSNVIPRSHRERIVLCMYILWEIYTYVYFQMRIMKKQNLWFQKYVKSKVDRVRTPNWLEDLIVESSLLRSKFLIAVQIFLSAYTCIPIRACV